MCSSLNKEQLSTLPSDFSIRSCRKDELNFWKAMQFDATKLEDVDENNRTFIDDYFRQVYLPKKEEFFKRCLFVVNEMNEPIATAFVWKAYDSFWTFHWFKVVKEYEGRGIGRALLSFVMNSVPNDHYPIYLSTHPLSQKAIKLYADMGFKFITDPVVGNRKNHLNESLPILKQSLPKNVFQQLHYTSAPADFLKAAKSSSIAEF